MATYVLLEFDDDKAARTFVQDTIKELGVRVDEFFSVNAKVRAVFKKPTMYCECVGGRKTETAHTRGKKYGWWVCTTCGKPTERWANGNQWYAIGTNLLPLALLEKLGLPTEHRPAGWKSEMAWTFLLDESDHDWDYKMYERQIVKWCYDHDNPLDTCLKGKVDSSPV